VQHLVSSGKVLPSLRRAFGISIPIGNVYPVVDDMRKSSCVGKAIEVALLWNVKAITVIYSARNTYL
jgi:hypothetical protein